MDVDKMDTDKTDAYINKLVEELKDQDMNRN